ncbi:hypothetical protein VNO80_10371 [Phaseolus coccineus]|uniref:Uncharacterized protein n=1 Tax=Phaseolus coccineus TaxID=3886 RepID=A0AAN9RDD6_PHACN
MGKEEVLCEYKQNRCVEVQTSCNKMAEYYTLKELKQSWMRMISSRTCRLYRGWVSLRRVTILANAECTSAILIGVVESGILQEAWILGAEAVMDEDDFKQDMVLMPSVLLVFCAEEVCAGCGL